MAAKAKAEATEEPTTVTLTSPWGTKVTVAADQAQLYKDANFTK